MPRNGCVKNRKRIPLLAGREVRWSEAVRLCDRYTPLAPRPAGRSRFVLHTSGLGYLWSSLFPSHDVRGVAWCVFRLWPLGRLMGLLPISFMDCVCTPLDPPLSAPRRPAMAFWDSSRLGPSKVQLAPINGLVALEALMIAPWPLN